MNEKPIGSKVKSLLRVCFDKLKGIFVSVIVKKRAMLHAIGVCIYLQHWHPSKAVEGYVQVVVHKHKFEYPPPPTTTTINNLITKLTIQTTTYCPSRLHWFIYVSYWYMFVSFCFACCVSNAVSCRHGVTVYLIETQSASGHCTILIK